MSACVTVERCIWLSTTAKNKALSEHRQGEEGIEK